MDRKHVGVVGSVEQHPEERDVSVQLVLHDPDGKPLVDELEQERRIAVPTRGYGKDGKRLSAGQEAFCWAYVFGGSGVAGIASRAYEFAFGQPDRPSASRMLQRDYIQERIAELTEEMKREAGITRENWLLWLRDISEQARIAGQFSPAVKALETVGKSLGFLDEKIDLAVTDNRSSEQKLLDIARKLASNPAVMQQMIAQHPELEGQIRKVVSVVRSRRPLDDEDGDD